MSFDKIFLIILFAIGLGFSIYWILPLGYKAWFHPIEFEKTMKERATHRWLNVYSPKYNWKAIMDIYRVFTLVFALVLLVIVIEILAGLLNFKL